MIFSPVIKIIHHRDTEKNIGHCEERGARRSNLDGAISNQIASLRSQ